MEHFISHLADSTFWRIVGILLLCLGVYVSTLESAKALLRLGQRKVERQRAAVAFAIENFDSLKDARKDIITRETLLMSSSRHDKERGEHIEVLLDTLDVYGHVIGSTGTGSSKNYIFALSRDDLTKAKNALG